MCSSSQLSSVPPELFSNRDVFQMVIQDSWTSLSQSTKDDLMQKFMPQELETSEKNETIHLLLNGDLKRFETNPLDMIYFQLRISKLAPDLSKTLEEVKILRKKAMRLKEKETQINLWKHVMRSRYMLLKSSLEFSPEDVMRVLKPKRLKCSDRETMTIKSCSPTILSLDQRFKHEMQLLTETSNIDFLDSSDDEFSCSKTTKCSFGPNFVMLSDANHHEDDIRYKKLIKNYKNKRKHVKTEKKPLGKSDVDELKRIMNRVDGVSKDFVHLEDPPTKSPIRPKPKKRIGHQSHSSLSPSCPKHTPASTKPFIQQISSSEKSPGTSSIATGIMSQKMQKLNVHRKESLDVFEFDDDSQPELSTVASSLTYPSGCITSNAPSSISTTATTNSPVITSTSGVTTCNTSIVVSTPTKHKTDGRSISYENAPASFFCLLRNIFREYSENDKLTLHRLEELTKDKLKGIDPKFGWNHELVQSAMNFLSIYSEPVNLKGQESKEMVPLVDYKEKNQLWQWIGKNRDSDDVLMRLCREWHQEKCRNPSSISDPSQPVPPPIHPTEWTVKPATEEERKIYREQEAIRYNNPNKSFTYTIHSYQSVVGPVKGVGIQKMGGARFTKLDAASPNKAREHNYLTRDRPQFVTLLSLVRDAAARLPNGEGTRSDICQLLRDSQYLQPSVTDQQLNQIVSGALDRLHYEKDPCVKYDVNRKIWIYLHRNRNESDFERLHEMQIAAAKAKRTLGKTSTQRRPSLPKPVSPSAPQKSVLDKQKEAEVSRVKSILNSVAAAEQKRSVPNLVPKVFGPASGVSREEKTVMDILSKQQGIITSAPMTLMSKTKSESVPRPVAMGPTVSSPVVSVVSIPTLTSTVTTPAPIQEKVVYRQLAPQKLPFNATSSIRVQPIIPVPGDSRPSMSTVVTSPSPIPVTQNCSIPKQNTQVTPPPVNIQPAQFPVPHSLFIGGRGHLVFAAPNGKSYMMAAAPGSFVMHPQTSGGPVVSTQAPLMASAGVGQQPVRPLPGIKVISMPTGPRVPQTILASSQQRPQQFMARIMTTRPSRQMVTLPTPSSLQPLLIAPAPAAQQQVRLPPQGISIPFQPSTQTSTIRVTPIPSEVCIRQSKPEPKVL